MHVKHRNSAVNYFHPIYCQNICDGSASACIDPSKFRRLEFHIIVFHNLTKFCNIFRICIVRPALSACSCIFIKYRSVCKIRRILFLIHFREHRIKCRTHIRREHLGIGKCPAKCKLAICSGQSHHLSHRIFKELRSHSAGAYTSDLFLVNKKTA